MSAAIQIITSFFGSLGFGILYNIKGKKLLLIGAGGMIGWIAFLWVNSAFHDPILALFVATLVVGALAEGLARWIKTPVTTLMVPMLIPMVPGSDLFYATSGFMLNEIESSGEALNLVLKEAAAIAFGIILVTCVVQIVQRFPFQKTNKA